MNVDLPPIHPDDVTILDACAGFGMLGEAVKIGLAALGLRGRVVAYVERDSAAAAALVARMGFSPLDQAPVCDDLAEFDGRPWRGLVDVACAGLPCQPYSLAGKRTGNIDHRSHGEDGGGPVPHFLRIVGECRPAVVFCENVPAWVVGGHFRSVGEELCRMGYALADPVFLAAADVGAPHERERVFVMAVADAERGRRWQHVPRRGLDRRGTVGRADPELAHLGESHGDRWRRPGPLSGRDAGAAGAGNGVARPGGAGRPEVGRGASGDEGEHAGRAAECDHVADGGCEGIPMAHSHGTGRGTIGFGRDAVQISQQDGTDVGDPEHLRASSVREEPVAGRRAARPDARRGELPLFPPGQGDANDPDHPDWWAWAAVAAVDPSLMPRVEPELSMVADGLAFSRADLLRIGGNGVVTLAAAVAFVRLWTRVFGEE